MCRICIPSSLWIGGVGGGGGGVWGLAFASHTIWGGGRGREHKTRDRVYIYIWYIHTHMHIYIHIYVYVFVYCWNIMNYFIPNQKHNGQNLVPLGMDTGKATTSISVYGIKGCTPCALFLEVTKCSASGYYLVKYVNLFFGIDIKGVNIHPKLLTLWLFNSSPWKITMLLIGKPSISMGHLYHGYV